MTAKIVEVLAEILEALNKNYTLDEVNKYISTKKDFDKQTVSAAFSLVYDKVLSSKLSKKRRDLEKKRTFRILTDDEKEIIGLENYNYLIRLNNIGLLDSIDFEMALEQLLMFPDDTITKDDINWIILISLVDLSAEILPGSRVLLYSSDTIN
ncbi:MAG: DUF494 family protein [Melioribacteraceae bacterium]|nr:DUF494 family protein [Melioribacteraceae bacterium]MCF8352914.1 DUF494 family protein [Melioribacteraceae bacterium]MCF8417431.1 DUF494 family protein [Melioribacteraceae bacterium]